MTRLLPLVLCLPLLLGMGCVRQRVIPLEDALAPHHGAEGQPAPVAGMPLLAVIGPFEDLRGAAPPPDQPFLIAELPLLGLWTTRTHTHPEATANQTGDALAGTRIAVEGDLAHALPRLVADRLEADGVFQNVEYVDTWQGASDLRRFDYVIEGEILRVRVRETTYDYGLNFFGLLDLSVLPKALAAPVASYRAEVEVALTVRERVSRRVVYSAVLLPDPAGTSTGYYRRALDGLPPAVGLLRILLEAGAGDFSRGLAAELP